METTQTQTNDPAAQTITTQDPATTTETGTTQNPTTTEVADGTTKTEDKQGTTATVLADFTLPEGVDVDKNSVAAFKEIAQEAGISQEAAQKIVDKMIGTLSERTAAQMDAAKAQFLADAKADKEIGGDKFDATVRAAQNFIDRYPGSQELKELLNASGMGNHKTAIKLFAWLDAKTGESKQVVNPGNGAGGANDSDTQTALQNMYPTMYK